jgi:hypothetical protein
LAIVHFAKSHFAKVHFAKVHFAKSHFAKVHFAKVHFSKVHFAKVHSGNDVFQHFNIEKLQVYLIINGVLVQFSSGP